MSLQSTIEAPAEQTGSAAAPSVSRGAGKTRRNLAVLMVAGASATALAFGGAAFMNAYFVSNASVSGQSVSTGTIGLSANISEGSVPISVTDLLPGDSATTEITVKNEGNIPVYLQAALPASGTPDPGLATELDATLTSGEDTAKTSFQDWQGKKLGIPTALEAGQTRTFTLTTDLPKEVADPALSGKTVAFDVTFTATQAKGTEAPEKGLK